MELDDIFAKECGIQLTYFIDAYECVAARLAGSATKKPASSFVASDFVSSLDLSNLDDPDDELFTRLRRYRLPSELARGVPRPRRESIIRIGLKTLSILGEKARLLRERARILRNSRGADDKKGGAKKVIKTEVASERTSSKTSSLEQMFERTGYSFRKPPG